MKSLLYRVTTVFCFLGFKGVEGELGIKQIHINILCNLPKDFHLEGLLDIAERGYGVPEHKYISS